MIFTPEVKIISAQVFNGKKVIFFTVFYRKLELKPNILLLWHYLKLA